MMCNSHEHLDKLSPVQTSLHFLRLIGTCKANGDLRLLHTAGTIWIVAQIEVVDEFFEARFSHEGERRVTCDLEEERFEE